MEITYIRDCMINRIFFESRTCVAFRLYCEQYKEWNLYRGTSITSECLVNPALTHYWPKPFILMPKEPFGVHTLLSGTFENETLLHLLTIFAYTCPNSRAYYCQSNITRFDHNVLCIQFTIPFTVAQKIANTSTFTQSIGPKLTKFGSYINWWTFIV